MPRPSLLQNCRLLYNERGASMVEFAVAAPVLAFLLAGISDFAQAVSGKFSVKQAVNRSLELVQASPPQSHARSSQVDYSHVAEEAAAAAAVPISAVTLTLWLQCDGERQADYHGSCQPGQDTARYLHLRIVKDWAGGLFVDSYQLVASGAVRIQ